MDRKNAVLLLGPTGAGKTPLGNYLEENGLGDCRCVHFDFGENLRMVAGGGDTSLTLSERSFVQDVLERGALLEDAKFYIAARIVEDFVVRREVCDADLMVMNGLPRHVGQAGDVGKLLDMKGVIALDCTAEVVFERIRLDTGGDRSGRTDDELEAVRNKLKIFGRRTRPLLDYYRQQGIAVREVPVGLYTTPADIVRDLSAGDNIMKM